MAKAWRRPRAKCPKCGFNLEGLDKGLENKGFRLAEKRELGTYRCPSCKAAIVPVSLS
jgi:predicted RNA-binding Zn-ribbon protein involved in translation (DUF1610 family)